MPAIDLTPPGICDPMTLPAIPPLPTGISLSVPLPGIATVFSARLCCKIFQLPVSLTPPISLGLGVVLPFAVVINTLTAQLNAYMRALPLRCPRE